MPIIDNPLMKTALEWCTMDGWKLRPEHEVAVRNEPKKMYALNDIKRVAIEGEAHADRKPKEEKTEDTKQVVPKSKGHRAGTKSKRQEETN